MTSPKASMKGWMSAMRTVAAAIANAVSDATGADVTTLPIDPEELLVALDKRQEG